MSSVVNGKIAKKYTMRIASIYVIGLFIFKSKSYANTIA